MITSRLLGGLGNQMFQYAAGLALARRLGTELRLDISWFARVANRRYDLGDFAITARPATARELIGVGVRPPGAVARALSVLSLAGFRGIRGHVQEPAFTYWPGFAELPDGTYLDGYWQSERYFEGIADSIRREFTARTPPDPENQRTLDAINSCESVAIHVRRGDYAASAHTHDYHGTTPLEYYEQAVARMRSQLPAATFFVFSDDATWTRKVLSVGEGTVFVTHNGSERSFEDLRLMSACRHHIIANSTFGWWGAWLANTEGQRVIAPRRWFKTDLDTRDLIPARWERL